MNRSKSNKVSYLKYIIESLNNSKFFFAIVMLLMNIGSKYVEIEFTKSQEHILRNFIIRELLIFSIVFVATKDVITSTLMTAAFTILSDYLLHEESSLCIMPERLQSIASMVDSNNDNVITEDEEKNALDILRKAEQQRLKGKINHGKLSQII